MFPRDPNAPGGPDRSESVQRDYAGRGRPRRRFKLFALADPGRARASGWPPVRQLTPLGSAPERGSTRHAA
jgi:hypothetical protein